MIRTLRLQIPSLEFCFCHKLKYIHMWGFPVYVLDPTLQQGHKLPKWQPRSRRRIFVGFSPNHSIDVHIIINPDTGHTYPQLHMIFENTFSTVLSFYPKGSTPSFWNEFDIDDFLHLLPLNDNEQASLYV